MKRRRQRRLRRLTHADRVSRAEHNARTGREFVGTQNGRRSLAAAAPKRERMTITQAKKRFRRIIAGLR